MQTSSNVSQSSNARWPARPGTWNGLVSAVLFLSKTSATLLRWIAPEFTLGVANLEEVCSDLDKDYACAAAKQAVPLLLREMNGLTKPEEVVHKFQLISEAPDAIQPFLDMLNMGSIDDGDGELLKQYLD